MIPSLSSTHSIASQLCNTCNAVDVVFSVSITVSLLKCVFPKTRPTSSPLTASHSPVPNHIGCHGVASSVVSIVVIVSVSTGRSFTIGSYITTEASDDPRDGAARMDLQNATTVRVRRGNGGSPDTSTITAAFQVVQLADGNGSVQRGEHDVASNTTSATLVIDAVPLVPLAAIDTVPRCTSNSLDNASAVYQRMVVAPPLAARSNVNVVVFVRRPRARPAGRGARRRCCRRAGRSRSRTAEHPGTGWR